MNRYLSKVVNHRRTQQNRAFTLIELLVVVAIITTLIALLVPALSEARISSKQVVCSSNLRQFGAAMGMYSNQNTNLFPPPQISSGDPQGPQGTWEQNLLPYLGYTQEFTGLVPWNLKAGIFHCPFDTFVFNPSQWFAPAPRKSYMLNWGADSNVPNFGFYTDYSAHSPSVFAHPSVPPYGYGNRVATDPSSGRWGPELLRRDPYATGGDVNRFVIMADDIVRDPNSQAPIMGNDQAPGNWIAFVRNYDGVSSPTGHPLGKGEYDRNGLLNDLSVQHFGNPLGTSTIPLLPDGYYFFFFHVK